MITLPNIVTTKKSTAGPLEEDRAFGRAVFAARGVDRPMPVIFDGRVIGIVYGKLNSMDVWYRRVNKYNCGFATYDDLISEMSAGKTFMSHFTKSHSDTPVGGHWYDLWPCDGNPQPGGYTNASARKLYNMSDTTAGAISHGGNVSADTKFLSWMYAVTDSQPPILVLYDRVATYEACVIEAANRTMDNATAASRYISGGQPGCKVMCTVQNATDATPSNMTQFRYTDQEGNTLQNINVFEIEINIPAPTTTFGAKVIVPSFASLSMASFMPFMPLLTGDSGVRLINDYTCSATNTGKMCFVLCQPLAIIPTLTSSIPTFMDMIYQVPMMERIYDGACLSLMMLAGSSSAHNIISGGLGFIWG